MFRKLKNNIDVGEYKILQQQMNYGYMVDGKFEGLWYALIDGPAVETMKNLIPVRYRKNFYCSSMKANTEIAPHTDNEIRTTINFYIDPQNFITQFYKFKSEDIPKYTIPSQMYKYVLRGGHRFEKSDLEETVSFVAQPNEVYVLDVMQPHGVRPLGEFKVRTSVTLFTPMYDYDLVCKMLEETGNL